MSLNPLNPVMIQIIDTKKPRNFKQSYLKDWDELESRAKFLESSFNFFKTALLSARFTNVGIR